MLDDLLMLWRRNELVNRFMLDNIPDAGLGAIPLLKGGKPGRGRNVARQLAHVIEARAAHARAVDKALMKALPPLEKGATPSRAWLEAGLAASGAAIEAMLTRVCAAGEQVHGAAPAVFLGYLVSHEAHHRGQILLALKQNGFSLSEELRWGLWAKWFKD